MVTWKDRSQKVKVMSATDLSRREKLLRAARPLFAELGYDQTPSELITDAAGLPASAIAEEFGGRRQLYLAVYQRVQEAELDLLEKLPPGKVDVGSYHRFVDRYLDLLLESPDHAALWAQRWLNDAADLREVEKVYIMPQLEAVEEITAELFREDLDVVLMNWTLGWAIQVFSLIGIPGHPERRDEEDIARFRRHLHTLLDLVIRKE